MVLVWHPHMKFQFGGPIGTPAIEQWSNTLRFRFPSVDPSAGVQPDRAQLQNMCDLLGGAVQDWMGRPASHINQAAKASWCKLNWIKSDGKQRDINTVVTDFTDQAGQSSTAPPPWFVTQVVTLRTEVSRGRAHAGRIYPPLVWPGLDPQTPFGPYISAAHAADIATSVAELIDSCQDRINSVIGGNLTGDINVAGHLVDCIVTSPGDSDKGTQPISLKITHTVVDRVPDVMHSRTRQVPRIEGTTAQIPASTGP